MSTLVGVGISLELRCCDDTSEELLAQMGSGKYDRCSVMDIPRSREEWLSEHTTARRRVARAYARRYWCADLEREKWENDIYKINSSAEHRQGRPMAKAYLQHQSFSPLPDYPCLRHATRISGVWTGSDHLVGYIVVLRQGALALVSQILGHASYLADEIMWPLFAYALEREIAAGPGVVVYNRHDSGTDGLRWWKERAGFREEAVSWLP